MFDGPYIETTVPYNSRPSGNFEERVDTNKNIALCEDLTHHLQIMRLTRCLLR